MLGHVQSRSSNRDYIRHRLTYEGEARGWAKAECLAVVEVVEKEVLTSTVEADDWEGYKADEVAALVAFAHVRAALDRVLRTHSLPGRL